MEVCGYQMKQLLGQGTTAKVYLAEKVDTGMRVAIKASSDCALLQQEERILKKVAQGVFPAVMGYFEQEEDGVRTGFLIMEYMEGGTLQQLIERHGCFTVFEAAEIVRDILERLRVLHGYTPPIIYRDLKPENIMFDRECKMRFIDGASMIPGKYRVGTYGYGAPEQFWEGAKPGIQCDLYAAGKILAYLLTGKHPGEPPYDMLDYCSKDKRIPEPIFRVLERCLAMEETGRYESAESLCMDLERALELCRRKRRRWKKSKQKIIYEKSIHRTVMKNFI